MKVALDTPVVILAGGLGTRLREETEYRPKPLVLVGHQPILWHIMKFYAHYGFKNFIICLGYKGEMIRDYFYNYGRNNGDVLVDLKHRSFHSMTQTDDEVDWNVILADTGKDTMTGGRIRRIKDYVRSERFFVTYGDGLSDVNLPELVATHERAGTIGTVTGVQPPSRFGDLIVEGDHVTRFREKHLADQWINGGFFLFRREFFDYIDSDYAVLEHKPLERLVADRQLSVHRHSGFWQCMDTYREAEMLNNMWSSGQSPWKVW